MSRNISHCLNVVLMGLVFALPTLSAPPALAFSLDYFVIQDQAEPLQIQENGKNHRGIVTDIVKRALAGTEHHIHIQTYPFERFRAALNNNKDKNWVTYGSPLWGDMQAANLSAEPILEVGHSLLTVKDSPFRFQNAQDLRGKIAVLLFGFDYPGLEAEIKSGRVNEVRVKNYDAAFRVVDRIKHKGGFVEMDMRLKYHMRRLGFSERDYRLHPMNTLIPKYHIHLAYSPGMQPDVQALLDKRLAEMKASGELEAIINQYR